MTDPMRTTCILEPDQITKRTGGRWDRDVKKPFHGVALDSRIVRSRDLFIALSGSRSNGHEHIADAERNGSAALMISSKTLWGSATVPMILVDDTLNALHALAAGCRDDFEGHVIAITGSVGKTTVKEMTSAICTREGETVSTRGNFNNVTGVPLSVLRMDASTDFAVIEIGMSAPGEIRSLAGIVRPHTAGILNVRPVHMENFKNLNEIAAAKAEIMEGVESGGTVVLNADDRLVRSFKPARTCHTVYYGRTPDARLGIGRVYEETVSLQRFELTWDDESFIVRLHAHGMHNRMNAAASAALALATGCSIDSVVHGLEDFRPGMMRSRIWKTGDGGLLLEDCYNSSPAALSAAIDTLTHLPTAGRRVLIMGDMLELGSSEDSYHRKAGEEAAAKDIACLIGFGPLADHAVAAFLHKNPHGIGIATDDMTETYDAVSSTHREGDVILVKGSRGMAMERIVQYIRMQWGLSEID